MRDGLASTNRPGARNSRPNQVAPKLYTADTYPKKHAFWKERSKATNSPLAQSRLAHQAQSVRHIGSGVRLNGKNVHSTPCATHKSVVCTQRAHNGEQTQVTDCDFRKSQSNNSFGGLRKADPSIRDDHRRLRLLLLLASAETTQQKQ
ncbi:hypothetical protein CSKR_107385 [Clonorchis sinensis]|uniref:Uncharacterized protein n=1 Tax=Clonorchis sinensis TaxID=79923 RepID=A0A3R7GH09_CLOSI|nr:hypothetical protein CSKR_107385 [Clonorchis sinensis]